MAVSNFHTLDFTIFKHFEIWYPILLYLYLGSRLSYRNFFSAFLLANDIIFQWFILFMICYCPMSINNICVKVFSILWKVISEASCKLITTYKLVFVFKTFLQQADQDWQYLLVCLQYHGNYFATPISKKWGSDGIFAGLDMLSLNLLCIVSWFDCVSLSYFVIYI